MNTTLRRGFLGAVCTALVAAGIQVIAAAPAGAAQASLASPGNLPSAVPSAHSPNVDDGRVFGIAQLGTTMVIGGSFTKVAGIAHTSVAAFDSSTGALASGFGPNVNGVVNQVIPGLNANTVYIGGAFTQVNGATAQFVALLDLTTGQLVPSFKPPTFDYGYVQDLVLRGSRLYVAGVFSKAGGKAHGGLVALNATTGAIDPFLNLQFTGHHNDSGSGAQGRIGPSDIDVTADGKTMVAIGNFKDVNGLLRDQVALIDLSGSAAAVAPWSTARYQPYCFNWAFDQYVRGVSFSPDGSYFVVNATGGGNAGTLCDATSRFETNLSTVNAQPTWIDQTGGDTVWGITNTSNVVFIGGHNRWENNPNGVDHPLPGAVPRAGLAALDPVTGRPYAWNPGRVPLGVSVFAMLATSDGLWIGSDTNYIGAHKYLREKLAMFPFTGGYAPASTATPGLPGTVFQGGNQPGSADGLTKVAFDGTSATATTADNQGIDFSNWRGAFYVGGTVYYGYTDRFLYSRTLDGGGAFGPAVKIDPYDDPAWSNVQTGDNDTFQGMVPSLYGQLGSVTGMVYSAGRLYYTLSGDSHLYSKWFLPDSGIMDETSVASTSSVDFSAADGMFVSGGTLYYASTDGNLRSVAFSGGTVSGVPSVVSGPAAGGVTWHNRAMFLGPVNQAPTAAFTSSCAALSCSFDGSSSSDSDGSVTGYAWDFGDGSTATGVTAQHTYSSANTYTVTLTVTDNGSAASAPVTHTVTVPVTHAVITFDGAANGGGGNVKFKEALVPSTAQLGDTALLFLTQSSTATWSGPTGVTGWTQIATYSTGSLVTTAWTKSIGSADVGAPVRFDSTGYSHASEDIAVYSGVDAANPLATVKQSGDASTSTHTTPTAYAGTDAFVVSYFGDRSTAPRTYTAPNGTVAREASPDAGTTLTTQALLADSGSPVSADSVGGVTATTDAATSSTAMWTIVLNPS